MMDRFTEAYIECALWASIDDNDEPLDGLYGVEDLAPEALRQILEDCEGFQLENPVDLADIDLSQAGHDFWLTRNRHGAGFWDRGLGDVGDRLTEAAHSYGESDLYVGDDGLLYVN